MKIYFLLISLFLQGCYEGLSKPISGPAPATPLDISKTPQPAVLDNSSWAGWWWTVPVGIVSAVGLGWFLKTPSSGGTLYTPQTWEVRHVENYAHTTVEGIFEEYHIPKNVFDLYQIGHSHYAQNNPLFNSRQNAFQSYIKSNDPKIGQMAGRNPNWIMETFGRSETDILQSQFQGVEPLISFSLKQIDDQYQKTILNKNLSGQAQIIRASGIGVNFLSQRYKKDEGPALVQLASQFNYLESPGTQVVPVSDYVTDTTQGPQASIEAGAAALYRYWSVTKKQTRHAFFELFKSEFLNTFGVPLATFYENGYLMLYKLSEHQQKQLLNHLTQHLELLRILPQWVLCEATGALQLQVLSAAPSYQGAKKPAYESTAGQIMALLVKAQYKALAQMAVVQALRHPEKITPVHLTALGQGAFNNPEKVYIEALREAILVVRNISNIRLFIHEFTGPKGTVTHMLQQEGFPNVPIWDRKAFF